jgi:cathepsin B
MVTLAPQDMVSCDYTNYGCNGGFLTGSLEYIMNEGLVTEDCLPYKNSAELCTYTCTNNPAQEYKKYYCKRGTMKIPTTHDAIKSEIMANGPMMVGFTIYKDFLSYSTGIYVPTTTEVAGGHAVKIIGWGTDATLGLYWICQN